MLRLYGATGLTPQALLSWALAKSFQIQELPEIGRTEHNKPYFPPCRVSTSTGATADRSSSVPWEIHRWG